MENKVDCSTKSFALWTDLDQQPSYWRTSQPSLLGDWTVYSERWPRSGMMLSGTAYLLPTLAHRTAVTASTSWPTPLARDYKDSGDWRKLAKYAHKKRLGCSVAASDKTSGGLNPTWVEWLMGFPEGWTDLNV